MANDFYYMRFIRLYCIAWTIGLSSFCSLLYILGFKFYELCNPESGKVFNKLK